VVDEAEDTARHFTQDDLRQLFEFKETECDTHDTFKCKRCKSGKQFVKAPALLYGDSSTYVEALSLLFLSLFSCFFPSSFLASPLPLKQYVGYELMIDGIISLILNWARCTMIF
jgi:hypothetical protein